MDIHINNVKRGMTVIIDNNLFLVQEYHHVKPGRQPAFVRLKIKNLKTNAIIERTFNTNIKLTQAHINKIKANYLYAAGDIHYFMNNEDYSQFEITKDVLDYNVNYLTPNTTVTVDFYDGEIINIELPEKMKFKVTETTEAIRGNTAQKATKDATIETGLIVRVPLFISEGEEIIVNTADGKYSSRS